MTIEDSRYVTVALIVSLVLNVLLGATVLRLKNTGPKAPSVPSRLPEGALLVPFSAEDSAGRQIVVHPADGMSTTVLYFLSPECSWCQRNLESVRALAAMSGSKYRMIGISLSPQRTPDTAKQYPFPVYFNPEPGLASSYGLSGTPQTMIVSSDGRVLKNLPGLYVGAVRTEIMRTLGVVLPD